MELNLNRYPQTPKELQKAISAVSYLIAKGVLPIWYVTETFPEAEDTKKILMLREEVITHGYYMLDHLERSVDYENGPVDPNKKIMRVQMRNEGEDLMTTLMLSIKELYDEVERSVPNFVKKQIDH